MIDPPFLLATLPISGILIPGWSWAWMLRSYAGSELEVDEPKFVEGWSEMLKKLGQMELPETLSQIASLKTQFL